MKTALLVIIASFCLIKSLFPLINISDKAEAKETNQSKISVTIDEYLSYFLIDDRTERRLNISTNSASGFIIITFDNNFRDIYYGPNYKSFNFNSNNFIVVANF